MERKFLKDLDIDGDTIDKIMDEHGKATNQLKDQLSQKKEELKTVKSERDDYKDKVDNDQFNEDKVNSLQSKYDDALKKIDDYEEKLNVQSLEKDIIKRIPDAYDTDDVLKLLDRDKFERDDDGNITNLDDVLNSFKEAKPNLFKGATNNNNQGANQDGEGKGGQQNEQGQQQGQQSGEGNVQKYNYVSGSAKGNPKGETDHVALGKELAEKYGNML